MSQRVSYTGDETTVESTIRINWLKGMYVANTLFAIFGLSVVIIPDTMRTVLGVPPGDPIHFGIAAGAVPFAFGIAGVFGYRSPVKFSPVLGLQVTYKSMFLLGVVLPLAIAGELPTFGLPLSVLFAVFIVGDLIAIPFAYLLSQHEDLR